LELLNKTEALEKLLLRLGPVHPQRDFIDTQLYRTAGGKRGEQRLKARFKEFWIEEEFNALWDVSLTLGDWPVQIDGLLLTGRCAVVIESKNISGEIHFNEATGEFFRIDSDGNKTTLEDPRVQLAKHVRFLERWFRQRKIALPVTGLAVFTAKQCEFASKPRGAPICKAYQMSDYLLNIWQSHPPNAANPKLPKISKLLLNHQTPFRRTPLCQHYSIDAADLKTGVLCRGCRTLTMKRAKRGWTCSRCGGRDPLAHESAVREYFSLVDSVLTNREFRRFCGVESIFVASRLLSQLDLKRSGDRKDRKYELKKQD
jgi:hypothetical protein